MYCKNCGKKNPQNSKFCQHCGIEFDIFVEPKIENGNKNFNVGKWIIIVFGVILLLFFVYLVAEEQPSEIPQNSTDSKTRKSFDQEEIASAVVNIFCPSMVEGEDGYRGSGTIITEDGIILTNSHIIPQDTEFVNVGDEGCLVSLPNPSTGQPEEIYLADPIVLPRISDEYDLAFLEIKEAFYDEETGKHMGTYPNTFKSFDDTERCIDEDIKLGEKITILGYPSLSGGYSLTITEGVVSSFPGDGLIVTSAKISEGNSGGLAIDENGCMLGVPSMVSYDETGSLGVIISTDLVDEFSTEVLTYLDKIK